MQRETMEQIYALLDATNFNPLPLCRGRPYEKSIDVTLFSFQSSPSMQRETLWHSFLAWGFVISILSLYAEGDSVKNILRCIQRHLNPLPLCRGRPLNSLVFIINLLFQSSPSMQRETRTGSRRIRTSYISILSLYAEGDFFYFFIVAFWHFISILSLYAEGDSHHVI